MGMIKNVKLTVVSKANDPSGVWEMSLDEITYLIKSSDKVRNMIQKLRNANSDQYEKMKRQLPQIIFSGVFEKRADNAIKSYSGLLVVDLDSKDNPQVNLVEMKSLLAQDPYIYAIFVSPSGRGLKILVRVAEPIGSVTDATALKKSHAASAKTFFSYLNHVYGLKADKSGTDLSRACFISWDPDLVINEKANIFKFKNFNCLEEYDFDEEDLELIESALQAIPFGIDFPYYDWLRIGLALASTLGVDKAVELMLKYGNHPNDTEEFLYERFKNPNGMLKIGTVFWYAKQYGWEFPNRRKNNSLVCGDGHQSDYKLVAVAASEVKPQQIQWIWKDRIARGVLHLIAGDPGVGKSQLTINIAATITRGGKWCDGQGIAPCGEVIIVNSEDDFSTVIVPRLKAAGADLNKIKLVEGVQLLKTETEDVQMFSLANPKHLKALGDHVNENTIMVIIDPLSSFFGSTKLNFYKSTDVQGVLNPLKIFAKEKNIAVVIVTHLNKQENNNNALYRIAGSHAVSGASRLVHVVGVHPHNPNLHVMATRKTNLSDNPHSLAFTINKAIIDNEIETSYVEWHPEISVDLSADDLLAVPIKKQGKKGGKLEECIEWLKNELANGPRKAKEIEEKAEEMGFSGITLRRAKEELNVVSKKVGYQGSYVWELPNNELDILMDLTESSDNEN